MEVSLIGVAIGAVVGVIIGRWLISRYESEIHMFLDNTLGKLLDKLGL